MKKKYRHQLLLLVLIFLAWCSSISAKALEIFNTRDTCPSADLKHNQLDREGTVSNRHFFFRIEKSIVESFQNLHERHKFLLNEYVAFETDLSELRHFSEILEHATKQYKTDYGAIRHKTYRYEKPTIRNTKENENSIVFQAFAFRTSISIPSRKIETTAQLKMKLPILIKKATTTAPSSSLSNMLIPKAVGRGILITVSRTHNNIQHLNFFGMDGHPMELCDENYEMTWATSNKLRTSVPLNTTSIKMIASSRESDQFFILHNDDGEIVSVRPYLHMNKNEEVCVTLTEEWIYKSKLETKQTENRTSFTMSHTDIVIYKGETKLVVVFLLFDQSNKTDVSNTKLFLELISTEKGLRTGAFSYTLKDLRGFETGNFNDFRPLITSGLGSSIFSVPNVIADINLKLGSIGRFYCDFTWENHEHITAIALDRTAAQKLFVGTSHGRLLVLQTGLKSCKIFKQIPLFIKEVGSLTYIQSIAKNLIIVTVANVLEGGSRMLLVHTEKGILSQTQLLGLKINDFDIVWNQPKTKGVDRIVLTCSDDKIRIYEFIQPSSKLIESSLFSSEHPVTSVLQRISGILPLFVIVGGIVFFQYHRVRNQLRGSRTWSDDCDLNDDNNFDTDAHEKNLLCYGTNANALTKLKLRPTDRHLLKRKQIMPDSNRTHQIEPSMHNNPLMHTFHQRLEAKREMRRLRFASTDREKSLSVSEKEELMKPKEQPGMDATDLLKKSNE